MPFPNFHSCRLVDPKKIKAGSYENLTFKHDGKTYNALTGKLIDTGKSVTQTLRYPKKIWNAAEAKAHCKSKGGHFEAAKEN